MPSLRNAIQLQRTIKQRVVPAHDAILSLKCACTPVGLVFSACSGTYVIIATGCCERQPLKVVSMQVVSN